MSSGPEGLHRLLQCLTGTQPRTCGPGLASSQRGRLTEENLQCSQDQGKQRCHVTPGIPSCARGVPHGWQSSRPAGTGTDDTVSPCFSSLGLAMVTDEQRTFQTWTTSSSLPEILVSPPVPHPLLEMLASVSSVGSPARNGCLLPQHIWV